MCKFTEINCFLKVLSQAEGWVVFWSDRHKDISDFGTMGMVPLNVLLYYSIITYTWLHNWKASKHLLLTVTKFYFVFQCAA